METHAYEITDRPGALLCVGVPPGRVRPALWLTTSQTGSTVHVILAQFHGEKQALVAVNFLDSLIGQIQRVIDHLAAGDGDGPKGDGWD